MSGPIRSKQILLTTYRRNGEGVPTPVWFVEDGERILVWTGANTGKVRRIRADPHVTIRPCGILGKPKGEAFEATARILPPKDGPGIQRMLNRRYGVDKRALDLYNEIARRARRRARVAAVYLEIVR